MIQRKFSKSFDDVLQQAYVFHSQFVADKSDFTAFSPQFATPFDADFLVDIQAADALPTNQDDLDDQQLITSQVEEKMEECRVHYQKFLTYIRLAWPDKSNIERKFGARQYEKARYMDVRMMNLMQKSEAKANLTEYNAAIIAAGFLQTDIDLFGTLADELTELSFEQEEFVNNSTDRSEERIVAFNKVWDIMAKISDAAKQIYADSPGKMATYILYHDAPTPNPPTAPEDLNFLPSSFMFSWDPSPTGTSYQLQYKLSINNDFLDAYSGSETSFNFNPGDGIWQFRVRSRNAGGYSDWSDIIVVQLPTTISPPINVSVLNELTPVVRNLITFTAPPEASSIDVYVSIVPLGAAEGMYNFDGNFAPSSPIERTVGTGLRFWYYLIAKDGTESSLESEHVYVDVEQGI